MRWSWRAASPRGWRPATAAEAERAIGHCMPGGPSSDENECPDGGCGGGGGMAVYAFHRVKASVMLWDIPVGYAAPRGPAVRFRVSYEHRDSLQPQTFSFANLGPKW